MKKANVALGILASIPIVAFILVVCAVGYFSKSRVTRRALGGPRAIVEVDQATLKRGFMGIQYESISDADRARLGIDAGVMINKVVPGSPAELSGIVIGDCLLKVDGVTVAGRDDLMVLCADWRPDQTVSLTLKRSDGEARVEQIVECRLISFDEVMELKSQLPARP